MISHQAEDSKHRLTIHYDEDPINPREDCDNFGTMVCFHGRYSLGDKHEFTIDGLKEFIRTEKQIVALPLYLYDHSGITMSTGRFSCPWDSGQVGYIYITHDEIRRNWNIDRVTRRYRDWAESLLESEVKMYDQYLTGDVYGFVLEEKVECATCGHVEYETIDICWGFFGSDLNENGIAHHIGMEYQHLLPEKYRIERK